MRVQRGLQLRQLIAEPELAERLPATVEQIRQAVRVQEAISPYTGLSVADLKRVDSNLEDRW
ncbi:hypothetical protein NLM31_09395 [Bradyrhizobium sp. CCGUVB4N]|uniref:hypothetical protein n=1 Tax=Bradyrhizobium sp. CCGUVB4N TaxID=2949631 RepID=UPI0020B34C23|nr:hypothetical protein [Bradyrhizobium sp. CCGUVB4N]MCP3380564.1 hypothetical protein [Bradyrhizobium sp. CCGUVB4N]